jgi:DNA-binding NarL/FixJ family response regulator
MEDRQGSNELERAVKEVQEGKTIRQVGKEMKICRMTITRFVMNLLTWVMCLQKSFFPCQKPQKERTEF